MKKAKLVPYSVSPALQRIFVYSALATFVVPLGYQIYMAATQYVSNPNLSAYYWVLLYMLVLPIALFIISYLISDKKKPASSRLFVSVLLSVAGMMSMTAIAVIINQFMLAMASSYDDPFWDWLTLEIASATIVTGAYTILLLALKRKGSF